MDIDTSGETNDCTPDLEYPDCPVQAADGLRRDARASTGCSDFFLCIVGAAGLDVAYCDDDGGLVITRASPMRRSEAVTPP